MLLSIVLADTVTTLDASCAGAVLVGASHGGTYSAYLAAKAQARAVLLNDAGVGLDEAGIAGLEFLQALRIPAATYATFSARIGDAKDAVRRGIVSHVNLAAAAFGCEAGDSVLACAQKMGAAPAHSYEVPAYGESRFAFDAGFAPPIWGIDSISLLRAEDAGAVVIASSHGGTIDGKTNVPVDVLAVALNDAGIGADRAGVATIPALEARGIAAVSIDHRSARIGDARSAWETGIVSTVNAIARANGVAPGGSIRSFAQRMAGRAVIAPAT